MSNEQVKNRIELSNDKIKLNGVDIDPSNLEITINSDRIITIKMELVGLVEFSDVDLEYN